ncbi:DNA-binding MarR family transcriptional regulator [Rhodococcus percolatus]|nr:DNA-binding MarR family transcriptional regulator [Rhodococcus opacus]MBP2202560.1 DNA-binding MarR family transcriptional regulator [Rhodococcus opacus]
MADLIVRTAANGATLTRIVDRLVSTAAVYREVDSVDRRKVRV